jgi:phosphohistidine swiveling domain-containing protein
MWNDSDRLGYKRFLDYQVKNNLFLVPPLGQKGSVWYSSDELQVINELLNSKLLDQDFEQSILATLDTNWLKLKTYLVDGQPLTSADELSRYYTSLVEWWSAMNTVFNVPDMDSAPADFKDKILSYRAESEKYTERMNHVFVDFWNEYAIPYVELVNILQPEEAVSIALGTMSETEIGLIKERLNGCFMCNGRVYLLSELENILKENELQFEEVTTTEVSEIKGRTAQMGKAVGQVKVIRLKSDTVKITQGDILVTEMTNPDYVPYMKIAGAIVTDEGGATCHAAIVSRELKIPCIVGTKIATKVLKDGDLVEVNADSGVVRIIK